MSFAVLLGGLGMPLDPTVDQPRSPVFVGVWTGAQVVIFCSKVDRAVELDRLLNLCNFPSLVIHSRLKQEERYVCVCVCL